MAHQAPPPIFATVHHIFSYSTQTISTQYLSADSQVRLLDQIQWGTCIHLLVNKHEHADVANQLWLGMPPSTHPIDLASSWHSNSYYSIRNSQILVCRSRESPHSFQRFLLNHYSDMSFLFAFFSQLADWYPCRLHVLITFHHVQRLRFSEFIPNWSLQM